MCKNNNIFGIFVSNLLTLSKMFPTSFNHTEYVTWIKVIVH